MGKNLHLKALDEGLYSLTIDVKDTKHNMLSAEVLGELEDCLSGLPGEKEIKALIIRSARDGSFIAGADINEIRGLSSPEEAREKAARGQTIMNRLEDLPFPTLAAIDGPCLGGGLELALACTARVVTDNPATRLGLPEVSLGIIPGFGGTYRLPRLIGIPESLEVILPGKSVAGRKALSLGLADALTAPPFLDQKARETALALSRGWRPKRKKRGGLLNAPLLRGIVYRGARKRVRKKSGDFYPAPYRALAVIKKGMRRSRAAALALEAQQFGRLAVGEVSKNLTGLFFASEALKKQPALRGEYSGGFGDPGSLSQATVLGAGVMGGKIAWLLSRNDIPVVMKDIAWEAVASGSAAATEVYRSMEKRGKISRREADYKLARISGTVEYRDIGRPEFLIEAVVENLDIKQKVLAEAESCIPETTVMATNTSALSVSEMAKALDNPERFVGMHFFNPVDRMPLVEIIPGKETDLEAVAFAARLAKNLGKTPVVVKDRPGFLVNRLLMPYLNEAVILFSDGVAIERLDGLLKGFGMPMGPFRLLDEIGIDVGFKVAHILHDAFPKRMPLKDAFGRMVNQGELKGKKSGAGFYRYPEKKPNPAVETYRENAKGLRGITDQELTMRPLLAMINEAAWAMGEEIVASAAELDMAMIMGTGFPPFRGGLLRYADSLGSSTLVEMLDRYAERYGPRFSPAPLLREMGAEDRLFYSD